MERVHEPDQGDRGGHVLRGEQHFRLRPAGAAHPRTRLRPGHVRRGAGPPLPRDQRRGRRPQGAPLLAGREGGTRGGLLNAAFLRARIQWLDHFFAPGEVGEVWLTFSDPQLGDKRGTKRLTPPHYLRLYQSLLVEGGVVHVKTDSPEFWESTLRDGPLTGMVEDRCDDVHGAPPPLRRGSRSRSPSGRPTRSAGSGRVGGSTCASASTAVDPPSSPRPGGCSRGLRARAGRSSPRQAPEDWPTGWWRPGAWGPQRLGDSAPGRLSLGTQRSGGPARWRPGAWRGPAGARRCQRGVSAGARSRAGPVAGVGRVFPSRLPRRK